MIRWLVLLGISALLALSAPTVALAKEDKTTALFADDAPLDLTISGPLRSIVRSAERSTAPEPGTLSAAGETHTIALSARGISRRQREKCKFPPLMLDLETKPGEASLFHRQNRIKLVTHCNDGASAEQQTLREYAAYRLYAAITPDSLKTRLVRVSYVDDEQMMDAKWGFLIEDADDAARRVGRKEADSGNIPLGTLDQQDAARFALFQYMIGNTDWAMIRGPDPADCCHNTKLLGAAKDAANDLTPVPYDFDNSGWVDAPYAYVNPQFRIRTVKTRVYRGFCSFNALIPQQVEAFRAARPAMEAELRAIPGLQTRTRDTLLRYLGSFFEDVATADRIESRLLGRCRE
uniref:hypothetical protein n=1 Tax=Parerythrobacter lutipelagi TaxID=1964208 RepID=UPI0010F8A383|nr:hypothetical protein [Parerythrobacter lutipelagi]